MSVKSICFYLRMCKTVLESCIWLFPTDILSPSLKLGSANLLSLPITALGLQTFHLCAWLLRRFWHLESDHHAYTVSRFYPVGPLSSPTGLIYPHSSFSQSTEVEGSPCCLNVYSLLEYVSYKYAANMDSFNTHAVGSHLLTVNMVLHTLKETRGLL